MNILYSNEQIFDLIPQRPPMVMVDTVFEADDHAICAALTVTEDNIFCCNGCLEETGLVEHIAQTAAALAGYETVSQHLPPRLGFIGEVKNFEWHELPRVGQTVQSSLEVIAKMAGVTLVQATTTLDNRPIASCQMKIFLLENQ